MSSLKQVLRQMVVILIRPTNYDDRGYPLRFRRGVLPSNSLRVMYSLTEQAFRAEAVPVSNFEIVMYDEGVWAKRIDRPEKLVRQYDDGQTQVVVGLVGVQTNQFPRARDLALRFKAAGAQVVIGGFHVSGSISTMFDGIAANDPKRPDVPCPHRMPTEISQLMNEGIVICHGESEEVWQQILADIANGCPRQLYRGGQPDLRQAPMPTEASDYLDKFATNIGTIDSGRGCPFQCSFCTIINVQGRTQRFREPANIIRMVKQTCERYGQASFFFTDDNFARNPYWEEILDGLTDLRHQGQKIGFMIEADLAAYRLKGFIPKLAAAGCRQIFLGVESLNQAVLKNAKKFQNQVASFSKTIDRLHTHGIAAHVALIIGWPAETRPSILADVERLKELGADQVSFFILTPLPGSEDHVRLHVQGAPMDPDLNNYDSFHAVTNHPILSRAEVRQAMFDCFKEFYRSQQMITALKRLPAASFWGMLRNYFWYRNSALGEGVHPMNCGFLSVRNRRERRPDLAKESLAAFWAQELWLRLKYLGHCFREFYVFEHVYFEARLKGEIADQWSAGADKARGFWGHFCDFWRYCWRRPSRHWLNSFWRHYGANKWQLFWRFDWHLLALPHAAIEVVYIWYFGLVLARNLATMAA